MAKKPKYLMTNEDIENEKKKKQYLFNDFVDFATKSYKDPLTFTKRHDSSFNLSEPISDSTYSQKPQTPVSLPKIKTTPVETNLASKNYDEGFWGNVRKKEEEIAKKWQETGIYKAISSFSNSGMGKFLDRLGDTSADTTTYGAGKIEKNDTGSNVANFIADTIGMGLGMAVNPTGMAGSANKMLNPIGKAAEKGVTKVLEPLAFKHAPNMVVYNAATKIIPSMAKGATEFGTLGLGEGLAHGEDLKNTAKRVGENALSGAIFGGATKAVGEYVLPAIKRNVVKTNTYTETMPQEAFLNELEAGTQPIALGGEAKFKEEIPKVLKAGETVNLNELAKNRHTKGMNLQLFPLKTPQVKGSGDFNNRRFVDTVRNAEVTAPEVKANLKDMPYEVKHNQDVYLLAKDYVGNKYDEAVALVKSNTEPTAEYNAIAQELMRKYQNEGKFELAADIAETVAKKATKQGQAIQALSMWSRLSPEGMLKYAQKQVNKANTELPDNKQIKLTEDFIKKLVEDMKKVEKMPNSYEKTVETAKVLADIDEQLPPSIWRKISTVQAMAQLLNPKTINRNIVGNTIFGGLENFSNVVGTPIDMVISKLTGKRTTTIPSLTTQFKAGKEEFVKAVKETLEGINTDNNIGKLEIGYGRTFKKNSALGKLETAMNIGLQATDRGFKGAVYEDVLRQQMKLAEITKPTQGMMDLAKSMAEYRTFQDTNGISEGFIGVKKSLNKMSALFTGTDEWGLGDLVIKYAKTPANILSRAIDYSPAGLLNTLKSLPMHGKTFNQKQFVDSLSRVGNGSLLLGIGYGLNKLGILTGTADRDKDVVRFNQQIGKSPYSINFDALKRYIQSENPDDAKPRKGDTFTTWDWAAPVSVVLGLGANVGQKKGNVTDLITVAADAAAAGMDTLFEQPLLSGIKTLTGYGNMADGLKNTALGIPSSFTPTFGKQISQLADNTARSTYNPNKGQQSINQVKVKLPGISSKLEPQINTFGEERKLYDRKGLKRGFDILLNPAFQNTYNPRNNIVMDIYENTGEKVQFPRVAPKYIKIGDKTYHLTPKEYTQYQRELGRGTQEILNKYEGAAATEVTANKIQREVTKLNKKLRDYLIEKNNLK